MVINMYVPDSKSKLIELANVFVCFSTYSQNQNHTLQICRLNTMETLHTTYLYNELRKLDFTFEINCSLFYADVLQECTYKKQLCIFGSNVSKAINSQL